MKISIYFTFFSLFLLSNYNFIITTNILASEENTQVKINLFSDLSESELFQSKQDLNIRERINVFENKKIKNLERNISSNIIKINEQITAIFKNAKTKNSVDSILFLNNKTIWGEDNNPNFKNYFKIDKEQVKNNLSEIVFNIDSAKTITAQNTKIIQNIINGNEYITWIGKVKDDAFSLVVITLRDDNISAQIDSEKYSIAIKPLGKGLHSVYDFGVAYQESKGGSIDSGNTDSASTNKSRRSDKNAQTQKDENQNATNTNDLREISKELDELVKRNNPNLVNGRGSISSADDDGSFVDVMIVYTSDVAAASSDIATEIASDIAYANEVLTQSCALFRIRLVHSEQVTYTETGDSLEDLCAVTNDATLSREYRYEGVHVDNVDSLRTAHGADLVQFWVENNYDYCGIGWLPPLGSNNPTYGFSVKIRSCGAGTTIHEMGHNLTLSHDRYQNDLSFYDTTAGGNGAATGYVITSLKVRDIMSYNTECANNGFNCTRIAYFPNPRVLYKGVPFGIPKIADAVERLNISRSEIANYKAATSEYSVDATSGCLATPSKEKGATSCFVATAAYGTYLDPHVKTLRDFRDDVLINFSFGRLFISLYEKYSPPYAKIIANNEMLKFITRAALTPVVAAIWIFLNHPLIFAFLLSLFLMLLAVLIFVLYTNHSPSLFRSHQRVLKMIITFFIFMSGSSNSYAYVAAPLIDPTEPAKNPAIVAFEKDAIRIAGRISEGDRKFTVSSKERESEDISMQEILASFTKSGFGGEVYSLLQKKKDRTEKLKSTSVSTSTKESTVGLNLSYKLFNFFSLGPHYSQEISTTAEQQIKTQKMGLGSSLRIADLLYFGGGLKYVRNEGTYYPSNTWTEFMGGLGLYVKAADQIFRAEVSYIYAPESIVAGTGANGTNYHAKTTDFILSGEALLGSTVLQQMSYGLVSGLVLGISKESITDASLAGGSADVKSDMTKYYLMLLMMQRRLYAGISLISKKIKIEENKSDENLIVFNAAFNF
ncbi:MAG: hypothetical protein HQK51_14640 [Oligoflexia bacterium]|nr:hypothetical protein [Oligoflexia bacterium]